MATVSEYLQERLRNALQAAGISFDEIPQLAPTADSRHGDYQSNAAMVLAKRLGEKPRNLAIRIVEALSVDRSEFSAETAGPGFINFKISPQFLREHFRCLAVDERLGVEPARCRRTIVIDFSSPNIAKPMHV